MFKAAADIICKDDKRAAAQRRLEREESSNTEDLGFSSHVAAGSVAHVSAPSMESSSKVSLREGSNAGGEHAEVEPDSVAISEEDVDVLDPEASAYDPSVASPGVRTLKSVRPGGCSEYEESPSRNEEGEEEDLSEKQESPGRHKDASPGIRPGAAQQTRQMEIIHESDDDLGDI